MFGIFVDYGYSITYFYPTHFYKFMQNIVKMY